MQKQEKSRKPLIIGIIAAVVILAVLLALLLTQCVGGQGNETSVPTTVDPNAVETYELYWNVDRAEYDGKSEAGLSSRMPEEDGYFHVRFIFDGQEVILKVADRKLVNSIDVQDVMGLEFDENGIVVGVMNLDDMPLEKVGWQFYVQSAARTMLKLNSSETMNGMEVILEDLDPNRIWDMSGKSGPVGSVAEAMDYDKVLAVQNLAGQVTHVFIYQRPNYMLTHEGYCQHCKKDVTWSEWVKEDKIPNMTGHYQLQVDIKNVSQTSLPEDTKLCLDLNGHRIDGKSGARVISMHNAGITLAIMDTSEKQNGVIASHGKTDQGGVVWVRYGAFYLYSGILDASDAYSLHNGVAVECGANKFFYMYGGEIIGGRAAYNYNAEKNTYSAGMGGALSIGGKFVMHDGVIRDGHAEAAVIYKDGKVSNHVRGYGGNIHLSSTAVFEMNGGTIKNGKAGSAGGNIFADGKAELTINGGTISGGLLYGKGKNGGSVNLASKTTTVMNGGSIIGGVSYNCGGNVYLNGTFTMNGGYIGGGVCYNFDTGKVKPAEASANFFNVNGKLYMWGGTIAGGVSVIDSAVNGTQNAVLGLFGVARIDGSTVNRNLTISGNGDGVKVMVSNMYDGAKIGVNTTVGLFTDPTNETYKKYFYSDIEGAEVVYFQERLGLGRVSCICGNSDAETESKTHINGCDGKLLMWAPWTSTNSIPTATGNYYLLNDVTTTKQTVVAAGNDVKLDLNGKDITLKVPASAQDGFRLYRTDGANLAITDTTTTPGTLRTFLPGEDAVYNGKTVKTKAEKDEDGKVIKEAVYFTEEEMRAAWKRGNFGSIFWVRGGTITLHNGIVDASHMEGAQAGMVINIGDLTVTDEKTGEKTKYEGVFNMHGGTVIGGYTKNAGNISISAGAEMNLYGGTITDGRANAGGNISVLGILNMYGGTVQNGIVDRSAEEVDGGAGGNINIDTAGTLNLYSGTIAGGYSRGGQKGGGHGGNIHVYGKLNATGGVIRDGETPAAGGNIGTIGSAAEIILDGVQVLNGKAGNGGNIGILVRSNKGLHILGETVVSGGVATGSKDAGGGNISISLWLNGNDRDQIVVIDGGTIDGGLARCNGGNIFVLNKTSDKFTTDEKTGAEKQTAYEVQVNVTMKSGTIKGGMNGVTDGDITAARGKYNGGSVYLSKRTTFTVEDGTITGGDTTDIGGNIYTNGQLTIKGGTIEEGLRAGTKAASSNIAVVDGNLTISGGVIGGNVAITPTSATGCKVILSGKPVVKQDVAGLSLNAYSSYLAPVIEIQGTLEEGSSVAVNGAGYISTTTPEANHKFFNSTSDAVLYHNERLFIGRSYCICGASLTEGKEHKQFEDKNGKLVGCDGTLQAWAKWTKTNALPTTAGMSDGYYYLGNDVTAVGGQQQIAANTHIRLDLNGMKSLRTNGGRQYATWNTGSNLTITDSVGTGLMKSTTSNATTDQGIIWGRYGTITLYGGTIDASEFTLKNAWTYNTEKSKWEGQRSGTAINAGTFNMFGGEIIGGKTEQYAVENLSGVMEWMDGTTGGAVGVGGTFNMFAGTIRDGQSGSTGGNVQVDGTFNMYGGEILNGSINKDGTLRGDLAYGGNVYADKMYMYGGLISGGQVQLPSKSATDENKAGGGGLGGNISVGTRFEAYGGVIENGYAHTGGNYGSNGGSVVVLLDGVKLQDGEAIGAGGNLAINVRVCKSVTITANSVLSGGIAGSNGGNIYLEARNGQGRGYGQGSVAPMNITISGKVEKGQAGGNGGNIYLVNADQTDDTKQDTVNLILDGATIDGGIVENNKTSGEAKGGNIFLVRVNAEIKDSQILNGRVVRNNGVKDQHADGGNIFASTCAVNITGSTISGGYAQSAPAKAEKKDGNTVIQAAEYFYARGGNIYFYNVNGFIDSTTIADGVAHGAGESGRGYAGNIYLQAATIEMRNGSKVLDGTTTSEKSGWSPSGNMFIASTSNVTVTDTEISGGNGRSSSNNIYLNEPKSTLTLGKGALVHNTVSGATVNICYRAGNLNILDGAVISNAEGITCRNIDYINEDNGVFTMSGGLITGGKTTSGGGANLRFNDKTAGKTMTATMTGGVIENGVVNNTSSNGGNLAIGNATTMTIGGDAKVLNGTVGNEGGNINVNGTLTIQENARIEGGSGKSAGFSNIFVVNGDLNVSGGFIDGGVQLTTTDAGVSNNDKSTLTLSGKPVITKNNGGVGFDGNSDKIIVNGTLEDGAEIWTRNVGTITTATVEANLGKFHHQLAPQEHDILFVKNDMIHAGGFAANEENTIYIGRYACVCGASVTGKNHVSFKDKNGTTQGCDGTLLKWTPWESTTDIPCAAGNWYLVNSVQRTIATDRYFDVAGLTYRLNLNGQTITHKPSDGAARLFRIVDKENIYVAVTDFDKKGNTDNGKVIATCTSGAQDGTIFWLTKATHKLDIYGGTFDAKAVKMADGKGGAVIQQNNGVVNQFGGTLVGGKSGANANGGNLRINVPATYNLFNGNIIGGEAVYKTEGGQGGNIVVYGTLNMYGGTVKDGISRNNNSGNNIMATSSGGNIAKLNIYGGTIAGGVCFNNANKDANGNIIKLGELTLAGKVIIDRSLTSDGVAKPVASLDFGASQNDINVSGLTEGSRIYIYTSGKFGINANETIKGYFHSEKTDGEVVLHNGTELHMGKVYCLCGATKTGSTTHAYWCDGEELSWIEWNKGNITVSGNYYAPTSTDNIINYEGQKTVYANDMTVNFDLNGQKLTCTNERAFTVRNGAHFSITDTVGNGSIAGTKKQNAGTIHVLRSTSANKVGTRDTVLNLYAGTFTFAGETATGGAVIEVGGITDFGYGIVNMYGGTITGGVGTNGGNVSVADLGIFNQYGGTISNGRANNGGNVYVTNVASFNQYGGKIINGSAKEYGGNICVSGKNASFNMMAPEAGVKCEAERLVSDGTLYSETTHTNGGNIYTSGSVVIKDGSKVTGGTATTQPTGEQKFTYGGSISARGADAKLTISGQGTEISGGHAITYAKGSTTTYSWAPGGNLYVDAAEVTISDGATLTGGRGNNMVSCDGSNIYVTNSNSKVTLNGAIICNNAFNNENVMVQLGKLTVMGDTRIYNEGVTGYSIITNDSQNSSNEEYVANVEIQGGTVENGIYINQADHLILSGGTVDGGIVLVGDKTDGNKEKTSLTVTGAPTVTATNGGIDLRSGKTIIVDGELTGGEIYVKNGGFITGDTTEDNLKYFKSTEGYGEYYHEGKIFFGMAGCLCANEGGEHTTGCIEAMKALDDDVLYYQPYDASVANNVLRNGGYWYLTGDKEVGNTNITLTGGKKLVLNLNGHTFTNKGMTSRFISTRAAGTSTIIFTDTSSNKLEEQGSIVLKGPDAKGNQGGLLWLVDHPDHPPVDKAAYLLGGTMDVTEYALTSNGGAAFNIGNGNAFHMYGGQILGQTGDQITSNGGALNISSGSFNMHGGIISGGRAAHGGNVYIGTSAVFNMTAGTIEGGSVNAGGLGPNVSVDGTLNMSGGEIKGGLYIKSDMATFTKGATVSKGSTYSVKVAEGKLISVKDLTGTIYVTAEPGNAFATNATIDHEKNVISEVYKSGKQVPVTYQGGQLYMGVPSMVYCLCGVDSDNAADHVDGCDGTKYQWILWDSTNTLPTEEGNYKLVYTINLEKVETPVAGSTIRIDLNGNKINLTDNENLYDFVDDGNVTIVITDASNTAEGEIALSGQTALSGGIMELKKGNTFQLYRATLNAGELRLVPSTAANTVGGVALVNTGATMDIFSGKIIGAKGERTEYEAGKYRSSLSGAIHLKGELNLHNGVITGGRTTGNGGNIYMDTGARFNMYGGEISDGVTGDGGGNISVQGGSTFHMEGGVIKGGKAVTIVDNKPSDTLTGNTQKFNIFVNGSFVEMSGGEIWGGVEVVAYARTCTVKLSGTAVIDGSLNPEGSKLPGLKLGDRKLDNGTVQTATVIVDGEMKPGASISLNSSMVDRIIGTAGEFAEGAVQYFRVDNGTMNVYAITQEMLDSCDNETFVSGDIGKLYVGQIHCVCGGLVAHGAGNKLCDGTLHVWKANNAIGTGSNLIKKAGDSNQSFFWYLTKSVSGLNKETSIIPDAANTTANNIHYWLDTNGFNVGSSGSRLFVARTSNSAKMTNCSINLVNTSATSKSLVTVTGTRDQGALLWVSGAATARIFNVDIDFEAKNSQAKQKVDGKDVPKVDANGNPVWSRHAGGLVSVAGAGSFLYMENVNLYSNRTEDSRYSNEFISVSVSGYAKNCSFTGANASAGAINVSGASFTLEDCTVQGNIGGGLDMSSSLYAKPTFKGETIITGNTASNGAARNVYVNANGTTHGAILLDASFSGSFGLGGAENVVVIPGAKTTDSNVSGHITVDDSTNKLADLDGGIIITDEANRIQCVCGGKAVGMTGHTCEKVVFTPVTDAIPLTSGNYYLTKGITLNKEWQPNSGSKIAIDLAGFDVTQGKSGRVITTVNRQNVVLHITDTSANETGELIALTGSATDQGGVMWLSDVSTGDNPPAGNSTCYLYAGTLNAENYVTLADFTTKKVDGKYQRDKTYGKDGAALSVAKTNTFYMYGGEIIGGDTGKKSAEYTNDDDSKVTLVAEWSSHGGAVAVTSGGTMYMYDGKIYGGHSIGDGGNLTVTGTFYMHGGSIEGGECANEGGNVMIYNAGNLYLMGGTISGGKAAKNGGSIHVRKGGTLHIEGSAQVKGGQAPAGGNISVAAGGVFNMSGGTVTGGFDVYKGANNTNPNTARTNGNLDLNGTMTMTGGKINGAAQVNSSATCTISGSAQIPNACNGLTASAVVTIGKLNADAKISFFLNGQSFNANKVIAQAEDGVELNVNNFDISLWRNGATGTFGVTVKDNKVYFTKSE